MTLDAWIAQLDCTLRNGERRFGQTGLALMVAAALMIFAGVYGSENFVPLGFGVNYARLATDPFNFSDPDILQNRLFAPIVAHFLGLRGNLFPVLTHGASLAFLATLYIAARRRDWQPAEATGLAALLSTSVNVLGEIHFPGMTDPISYLGLLWAMLARSAWGYGAGITLALLNHESNLFALPWLLAYAFAGTTSWPGRCARAAATLAAAGAFWAARACLHLCIASDVPLSPEDYLSWAAISATVAANLRFGALGVFAAYKLLWLLPMAAALQGWHSGAYRQSAWLALVVACALAQLLVAEDVTRLMGLAFPAILAGATMLRDRRGHDAFSRWLWRLILLNLLVPTVFVFLGGRITPIYPLPVTMLVQAVFDLPL